MWTWKPEGLEYFIWILPPNAVGHDLVLQETAQPHSPIACGPRGSGRANREQAHCVLVAPNQERSSHLPRNATRLTGSELQLRVRIRVVSACKTYNSRSRTARQNRALSTSLVLSNWEVMRCILHLST